MVIESLPGEKWKTVFFAPRYKVSNKGRIRLANGEISEQKPNKESGYLLFSFSTDEGKIILKMVHVVVAMHFIPGIRGKNKVNHKNGIRHDNRVENLEWCTDSENSYRKIFPNYGHTTRKVVQYTKDGKEIIKIWESATKAQKALDIQQQNISKCCLGKIKSIGGYTWKYYEEIEEGYEDEIWKTVIFRGKEYTVSDYGRLKTKRGIRFGSNNGGYKLFNGVGVHIIVCFAFYGPAPKHKTQVNHKNTNKKDNRAFNLEWCTQSENIKHAIKMGLFDNRPKYHLKPVVCLEKDGSFVKEYESTTEASRQTGIPNIIRVCKGRTKTGGGYIWRYKADYEKDPNIKIDLDQKVRAVERIDEDGNVIKWYKSATLAAEKLDVPVNSIRRVCRGDRATAYGYRWQWA